MTDNDQTGHLLGTLFSQRVIAIVRAESAETALAQTRRLVLAGIRIIEVSLDTPGALDVIAEMASSHADLQIGVGTAMTANHVREAASVGARFFISPVLDLPSVATARDMGLGSFPGCATPTEIASAIRAGATGIKLFPATLWSPQALKDLRQAMPFTHYVPTGGVTLDNVSAWLDAGAMAVGLGSALTSGCVEDNVRQIFSLAEASPSEPVTDQAW